MQTSGIYGSRADYEKFNPYVVANVWTLNVREGYYGTASEAVSVTRYKTRKDALASDYAQNGGSVFTDRQYKKWIAENQHRFVYGENA